MRRRPTWTGMAKRVALLCGGCAVLAAALFCANGLSRAWRTPAAGAGPGTVCTERVREVRVLALNAAKCSFHAGGLAFARVEEVTVRLDRISAVIRRERADLVFLSEVVMEAGPAPLDQVEYLARQGGFARFASGENYSFGLSFYRIRSGNAVLSRFDLRPLETVQLAGQQPFWRPTNNRRALWLELEINGAWLLAASIRNDSFDLANNLRQVEQLLAYAGPRPALLAGDFNAEPGTPPIERLLATGSFTAKVDAPPTYPAAGPTRRIDHVFAPASWTLTEQRVVDTGVSDHLAVVMVFALP